MFTQSCFVRKNTHELREKLRRLGQRANTLDDFKHEWLAANYGMFISVSKGFENLNPSDVDCGTNEELFLAIAALRDDTDKYQWFVLDTHLSFNPNANCIEYSKGNFIKCVRDKWNVDFNEDGTPCEFSSRNIPAHKATVEELIEHFKDR